MMDKIISRPAAGGQEFAVPQQFLEFLFGEYQSGFAELRHSLTVTLTKSDSSDFLPLPFDWKNIAHFSGQIYNAGVVRFGPAPRLLPTKNGRAATDALVAEIGCVWGEINYDQMPGGAIEIVRRVKTLPLRPSVLVNSGYGRHVYYVLAKPLRDGQLLDWEELVRALGTALGSAVSINPSRLMILPTMLNRERGYAAPCEIVEEDSSWIRYSLEELKKSFLTELPAVSGENSGANNSVSVEEAKEKDKAFGTSFSAAPTQVHQPAEKNAHRKVFAPTIDSLRERNVPQSIIQAIITGKCADRSSAKNADNVSKKEQQTRRDLRIAASLLSKGFTQEEVKAVFHAHPLGCGNLATKTKGGEKYLEQSIRNAATLTMHGGSNENSFFWTPGESLPPNYEMDAGGTLWLTTPPAKEGGEPKLTFVAESAVYIAEIHENIDTDQISVLIAFHYLGRRRTTKITRAQMCDARALTATLSGGGAPVSSVNARTLVAYLTAYESAFASFIPHRKVTSKFGRNGKSGNLFFLPGLTSVGIDFAPNSSGDMSIYRAFAARRGTLREWSAAMNELADAQLIIPQIAVCAAFVPPLQRFLQIPNFILDIYGNTSSGKSTTLKIAASVFGNPVDSDSLVHQWMNTKTAIEQLAGLCSELPIFLDDAQHCSDELKRTVIYMIANGKGKGRGTRGGGIQETMTWQTVALSTSEEPLHESSPHEGARGRLLPVGGLIAPFPANSGAFVQRVERAVAANHGIAGETFVRHLNGWTEKEWSIRRRRYYELKAELLLSSSSDIIGRVSSYIAAVAVAGEIACPLLGLRFKPDVIAVWLLNHLHEQQSNQNITLLALRALADHYVANMNAFAGSDRYDSRMRSGLQGVIRQNEYIGFLRTTLDVVFAKRKWNPTAILNKLAESGALHATEADRHTKKVSVEGIKHRMICIKWSALLPDDSALIID